LVLDHPREHDWGPVGTMIPTIASGDMHNLLVRFCGALITAVDRETGRVEMGKGRREAQTPRCRGSNETVEGPHPVSIESIQGPAERIIVELGRGDAGRNEAGGGLMLEEPRDKVEGVMHTPQTIEHHGFDGFPSCEVPHCRMLLGGAINDVPDAEFVAHASDKAEVIQDLTTIRGRVGHNNLL
jgi:hypothetical protein